MDILMRVLADKLEKGEIKLEIDREVTAEIEKECMEVLGRIRAILADESIEDPECFERIEQIVCAMESIGLNCGSRHDYG
jgi:hypothetical protein